MFITSRNSTLATIYRKRYQMSSGLLFTKEAVAGPVATQSMLASSLAQPRREDVERVFAATGTVVSDLPHQPVEQLPIPPGFAAGNAIRALLSVYAARNGGVLPAVYSSNGLLAVPPFPLPHVSLVDLARYEIRIVDESDGSVDVDFPPVDHGACLTSVGVERFALSDAATDALILGFRIRLQPPEIPDAPAPLLMLVDRFPPRPPTSAGSTVPPPVPFPVYLMATPVAADAPYGSLPGGSQAMPIPASLRASRLHHFAGGSQIDSPSPSGTADRRDRASSGSRSSTAGRESGFGCGGAMDD